MNNSDFIIFPAIHLRNGEVVRFTQGDIENPIVFHTDPLACAQQWIDQGVEWLQVVNLDAAFDEETSHNWALIEEISKLSVNIQFGGGIRCLDDVHWAMKSGIKRVIIGTASVENPKLVADAIASYGSDAIILGIDADQKGEVQIHGWQTGGSIQATGLAIQMRQLGVTHAIHTSIHRDGSMTGVDIQASIELADISGLKITVGGGIGSFEDILECYDNEGIEGVIIGKALYTGKVQFDQAIRKLRQRNSFEAGMARWKADQDTPWKRFIYQLVENNLRRHIAVDSPPLTILDAGGGNGIDSLALARMNHQVNIVDTSQQMLNEASSNAALAGVSARVNTHAIDLLSIAREFPENHFDFVLCHNVIQFVDNLQSLLEVLYRVLRPGGFLSLITINQYSQLYQSAYLDQDLETAYQRLDENQHSHSIFDVAMKVYAADQLIQWLESQGYALEKHYGIGCLYFDWVEDGSPQARKKIEKLKKLEVALMDHEPYKRSARYFQLILQKR